MPREDLNDQAKAFLKKYLNVTLAETSGNEQNPPADTDGQSNARLRDARQEWLRVREDAIKEMSRLKLSIMQTFDGLDEFQGQVDSAMRRLDQTFQRLNGTLDGHLDAVLNEVDPERRQDLANVARQTASAFASYVESDTVMAQLDSNELLPDIAITAPIRNALNTISGALG